MTNKKNDIDSFFTPSTLYNLPTAGIAVWITCLVIGSIFEDLSSFWFRIIALGISLLISISLFIKNKTWRKPPHYILILLNAALIFVNASGLNTITYSYPFENFRYKKTDSLHLVKQSGFFDFVNQKNWWPDTKLIKENDSLKISLTKTKETEQKLLDEFSLLRDWVQTNIKDTKSRDTLKSILGSIGQYNTSISERNFFNNYISKDSLNKITDSLKLRSFNSSIYVKSKDKELTAMEYINDLISELNKTSNNYNSLLKENMETNSKLSLAKIYFGITDKKLDSLYKDVRK